MTGTGNVEKISPDGVIDQVGTSAKILGLALGPDSTLWYTAPGAVGKLDLATGRPIAAYADERPGGVPYYITLGPDGNMWATEVWDVDNGVSGAGVLRITPSGVMTEFTAGIAQERSRPTSWPAPTATSGSPRSTQPRSVGSLHRAS